ncbi:MAG: TonB-dependent receptor [Gammaproteobacteria bacterium]|nr:TonB-dependent receptor [Gammaproteobacteria bacterium]NNF48743.1 TonB-dependent receptor [Woeseiaceae bacterium]MBT8094588.1 TonB-dependent receptor [Gammaproteobacteria bacterium]MBT8106353.1 TonB-dependent receptor [Gammaproteobacteria bacterium]NNK26368.1 TonB-dependent receptor [Woeseiaceae bacterium]
MLLSLALPATVVFPQQAFAQSGGADEMIEEIVTTGTRRADRSASDSPVPIDVIGGTEISQNAYSDVQELLRTAVPSFDVNTQPISDAATIVRPANVRGLSPDNVLVLVNGKRRHRGSVISFLGGGISDGAQGVDISAIPSLALKQVEVLRDGASSQYGSDAIAGVLNFVLRDDAEGAEVQVSYGSTYENDGDNYRIAGNIGLPLGNSGFINLTGEINDTEGTIRSVVRDDVQALIAAGNTDVADFLTVNSYTSEVPQYWGQPDVDDDIKLFVNSAFELSESAEVYFFGNYAQRTAEGGFFFRNPTNRGGVYAGPTVDPLTGDPLDADDGGVASIRVGDLDGLGVGGTCPAGIPLTGTDGLIGDADILAQVVADANCFSFVETIPSGFVPRFGGDNEDMAVAAGIRGEFDLGSGLSYDFSASRGSNRSDFFIRNTINASLGPDTPRDFTPGGQEQTETMVNADFVYAVDTGFTSDLNVAFGAEYRKEEFDLFAGDPASYALGPLADQGFSSSSNGFGGFPNNTSADQDSYAVYVDLEADLTEQFTMQAAVRFEDFSEFGDTTDIKVAGIYHVSDTVSIRGAFSTGFHAPTAGQANITNVTTQNVGGVLIDQGTLPLSSAAGQLAADFIESQGNGRPSLGPEDARNFALGVAFDIGGSSWTVDFYDIQLEDRVALGANVDFLDALNFAGGGTSYTSVSEALTELDADGVIDRQDFIGLDDLSQFRFFSNSFDTSTTGIDVVGRWDFGLGNGESNITVAANYNKTEVDDVGTVNPIDADRVRALEDLLPNVKGSVTWTHSADKLRTLVRANYYGGWDDTGNGVDGLSAEVLFDVEAGYQLTESIELIGGVANILNSYPDVNPGAGDLGQQYSEASPFGFNGGMWYLKGRMTF